MEKLNKEENWPLQVLDGGAVADFKKKRRNEMQ